MRWLAVGGCWGLPLILALALISLRRSLVGIGRGNEAFQLAMIPEVLAGVVQIPAAGRVTIDRKSVV